MAKNPEIDHPELTENIKAKIIGREKKKKLKMLVSGKSVFQLKAIKNKKK